MTMFTTKFALFGLVLSLIRASFEWQLMKCCPPGEMFVFNSTICKLMPTFAIEVYSHYWNITNEFPGIPQCNKPEDLVTTPLDDLESNTILEVPACFELFYTENAYEPIIIIHHCRSNKDQQVKTINASFEQFLHIRRCCFGDTIFDRRIKTCVTQLNETQSLGAFLLNRLSDAESAVILTHGPPECQGPIVNYEINENEIFLRNNTYSVKVPELNNVVKEEPVIGDNICIEMMSEFAVKRSLAVRICRKPEFCDKNACIRKCCSEDEHLHFLKYENITLIDCNTLSGPNKSEKFYNALANAMSQTKSFTFNTTKVHGIWSNVINPFIYTPCKEIHRFWNPDEWEERMSSKSNGHTNGRHCFDVVEDKVNNFYRFELLYCDEYTVKQNTRTYVIQRSASYFPLTVIKGVFLLITLLVYAFLPNMHGNIHGKMVICYVSNVLLSTILTFISISFNVVLPKQQRRIECKFLAYIRFFSGHATVFWLNVICFDMWRTITTFKNRKNYNNRKRFLLYCLYGWGIPLLLSILIIVADNTNFLPKYLIPNIGNDSCGMKYGITLKIEEKEVL
ncbi:uncharacterized protein LOC120358705 [Solenopsis invicta]|nr:uncharacterized protein LOC120358705 [Solenopsis invicta]